MCTINKIRVQNVLTWTNTKVNVSSSLDDLQIIKAFKIHATLPHAPKIIEMLWHHPHFDWMKCNCDGVYRLDSLLAGCGWIFLKQSWKFRACFC